MGPYELEEAVSESDLAAVRAYLRAGLDPNSTLHGLDIPIVQIALENRDEPMARLLVEFGADIERPDNSGASRLFKAASAVDGNAEVELLLRLGADPNRADNAGWTALHRAASLGYRQNAKALLLSGADPNLRTANGFDAAEIGQAAGHHDIFTE